MRADMLEAWGEHLAHGRRRSPHTVRAYVATAARLLDELGDVDWTAIAALDTPDLRAQLARRRAEGIGNVSAARELSALTDYNKAVVELQRVIGTTLSTNDVDVMKVRGTGDETDH